MTTKLITFSQAHTLVKSGRFEELRRSNITENFTWGEAFVNRTDAEIATAPYTVYQNLVDTFKVLQKVIRNHYNKPVTVTSGWRDTASNKKAGGAVRSQHLFGKAVDFTVSGVTSTHVQVYLNSINFAGGLGYGKTFTHIDTRNDKARFGYA